MTDGEDQDMAREPKREEEGNSFGKLLPMK